MESEVRSAKSEGTASRLAQLSMEYLALVAKLRLGGGPERAKKMHAKGQLTPRERVEGLIDPKGPWFELGLLVAYDRYDGQAPNDRLQRHQSKRLGPLGRGHQRPCVDQLMLHPTGGDSPGERYRSLE